MRTPLDLDDEILQAAKELARQRRVAIGKVVSGLVREALTHRSIGPEVAPTVAGFRPFPSDGCVVTNAQVDALRDAEGV
ncbi:MAG: hypothetical protein IPH35_00470 [Rhodoferax sp.]|nr:hypothetical protein [Rhodoferax sp.]